MPETFFSIILPTYNRAAYIAKAVGSVLEQSYQNFELIIVDDASTDNTEEIVNSFKDNRIVYIKNNTNQERCISRNKGIERAKGKYICFLDSDDYHLPEHLEKLHTLILSKQEPEAFFFTNAWNEDVEGQRTVRVCPDFEKIDPCTYFLHYTVNPQRWAVHRNIFEKIKFDPEVTICEDIDTSLRIATAGYSIHQLKERTTVYVAALDSFTHSDKNKAEKELFYLKKIFDRKELKGKLPSVEKNRLLSMCHYHLTIKAFEQNKQWRVLKHSFQSFFLHPKGYNGKTNKTLMTMSLYSLPLVGSIIKKAIHLFK